jgi:hypothetical protein
MEAEMNDGTPSQGEPEMFTCPLCRCDVQAGEIPCDSADCALHESDVADPRSGLATGWPETLPTDVIVACVGGGITCAQVEHIYRLVRTAMELHRGR